MLEIFSDYDRVSQLALARIEIVFLMRGVLVNQIYRICWYHIK